MSKESCLLALFVLSCAAQTSVSTPPLISVDTLRKEFYRKPYNNEKVAIQGWVAHERRVVSKTFKGYHLRDRFGDIILVRTTEPLPDITSEILVIGVALKDADSGEAFLSEIQRQMLPTKKESSPAPNLKDVKPVKIAEQEWLSPIQIGLGVVVVLLVAGAAFLMMQKRRDGGPQARVVPNSAGAAISSSMTSPVATPAPPPSASQPQDYATVKVYPTTKVLPGKLIVLVNNQETDVIHLSDQFGNGEIEIGRDSPDVMGGIRVKDKTNTVSRKQAKLLYSAVGREFKLVNLAGDNSNPTVVNGQSLVQNETVVLRDNDVVGMGNLELKFRSN